MSIDIFHNIELYVILDTKMYIKIHLVIMPKLLYSQINNEYI